MQADNIRILVDSINVFDENEITEKLSGLEGYKLKKSFLEEVYNTIIRKKKHFDPELGKPGEKIEEKVQRIIYGLDYELREKRSAIKEKSNPARENISIKVTSNSGISDIVRIFEAMKKAKIISSNTRTEDIVAIFFRDKLEIKNKTASYLARSNDINNNLRNSNSKELFDFLKCMITQSFSIKWNNLEKLDDLITELLDKKYK